MRFNNLQVGRFLAAAAVVVFHAACHGQDRLGVSSPLTTSMAAYWLCSSVVFFFALSGFVLAHGLQTAPLGAFLRGRLLRLYPAYWAAAVIVVAVRWAVDARLPWDVRSAVYAATLWPGGPNRAAYHLGVEWTLVYEVFLSLTLVPLAALGRRRGLGIGAAVWLVALVGWQAKTGGQPRPAFPTPGQLPLSVLNAPFLLGVLIYLNRERLARWRPVVLPLSAVLMAAGAWVLTAAPGWSYLLQSAGTAGVVALLAGGRQLTTGHPLVRAGDWSYGIYLMHVPVMIGVYAVAADRMPAKLAVWVGGGLALVVSAGYGMIEWAVYRRLRRGGIGFALFRSPRPETHTRDHHDSSARQHPGRRAGRSAGTRIGHLLARLLAGRPDAGVR